MRYAIISDIHANLEALDTALQHIDTLAVNEIVCLGDVVGYGPNPNECIELIRTRCKHTVLGNHDIAALDLEQTLYMNNLARDAAYWTHNHLTERSRTFLQGLPLVVEIEHATLVHASPFEPDEWHYIMSSYDAETAFQQFTTPVCFIGHSHRPGEFWYERNGSDEKKRIVNVGSIGQPRDNDPRLSFGLFDTETLQYENIRLPYAMEVTARKIEQAGLPTALAERLYYGL
jgi:diadenosine tetraphosphatase ApaH/serine/threonine PP2A family protein phosphatase